MSQVCFVGLDIGLIITSSHVAHGEVYILANKKPISSSKHFAVNSHYSYSFVLVVEISSFGLEEEAIPKTMLV